MTVRNLPPMSEAQFQQRVLDYCRLRGILAYHTHDSRRSQPGFPDLVIVGTRVLFRELKTDTGKLTPDQERWILRLQAAGADVAVWRPASWDLIVSILDSVR